MKDAEIEAAIAAMKDTFDELVCFGPFSWRRYQLSHRPRDRARGQPKMRGKKRKAHLREGVRRTLAGPHRVVQYEGILGELMK